MRDSEARLKLLELESFVKQRLPIEVANAVITHFDERFEATMAQVRDAVARLVERQDSADELIEFLSADAAVVRASVHDLTARFERVLQGVAALTTQESVALDSSHEEVSA